MIKVYLILLFLIPLCFTNVNIVLLVFQYSYLFIYLIFLLINFNYYFSSISYGFGLDIYSYGLILITLIISLLIIISIVNYRNFYMFLFVNLLLTISLLVIFSSLSLIYIYIYFEFVLIPLLILIIGWGYQPERLLAGLYLFMYTFLVSLPFLFLIMYLYKSLGSLFFDYLVLRNFYIFNHIILVIVFIVKIPIYIVHFWLPKAHVQAPVSGSILLAGVILKIGGYGLIRTIYIFEYIFIYNSYIWFSISLLGSIIISLLCLVQADIKCIIAYSSISHIGIVIIGLITMSSWGLFGSYFLILGHGFCSSGLFYISNLFYFRTNSRRFYINKGLLNYIPTRGLFFFLLCAFNIRCPPRLNFIREIIIIPRIINFWINSLVYFCFLSFLCACFRYYLYRYRFQGLYHNLYRFSMINVYEFLCLFIHIIPLIFIPLIAINLT